MTHSETQTLFCTDSQSISLGVAEVGTLKLDLKARTQIVKSFEIPHHEVCEGVQVTNCFRYGQVAPICES